MRGVKGIKEATVKLPVNATTVKAGTAGKEVGADSAWCSAASLQSLISTFPGIGIKAASHYRRPRAILQPPSSDWRLLDCAPLRICC